MQKQHSATSLRGDAIDGFVSGDPKEYVIDPEPAAPLAFPPAADFPHGGVFLIYVPAGGDVRIRRTADGPGFPLLPGITRRVFRSAESHVLTNGGSEPVEIAVEANAQVLPNV